MKNNKKEKKGKKGLSVLLLLLLLLGVTIGYSVLSTTLNINGTSKIANATWDVHFANIVANTSSTVTPSSGPTISADGHTITYNVDLDIPGDFYEFAVDVENTGSIDAKLKTVPTISGVSTEQDVYVNYTFLHSDGTAVAANEVIAAGAKDTYKVRVEFDREIENDDLPEEEQDLTLTVVMNWEQA